MASSKSAVVETFELYGGKVKLNFQPSRHLYTVDEKKIDGVTSILGVISKPQLIGWASGLAASHLKPFLLNGHTLTPEGIDELCKEAKNAHLKRRDKAGEVGTMVHTWIENYIKGTRLPEPTEAQVRNGVTAFLEWVESHHVEFIHSERLVYSDKYNYAGTLDFVAKIDGKLFLGDIKTSSGVYPEMFLQTAAYQHALEEEDGMQAYEGNIIVNCQKTGDLEVKTSTAADYERNFKGFLGALTLYRCLNELKKDYENV